MSSQSESKLMEEPVTFQWQLNWKVLLFSALFFPLTLQLGFWQLSRAEEKREILAVHEGREKAPPVGLMNIDHAADRQYLKVELEGQYDNSRVLLLDNRVRRGQPGYEVVSVFRAEGLPALLVNRGWIKAGPSREELPDVPALNRPVEISGYLYQSPGKQLMLGEEQWDKDKALQIVQNAAPEIAVDQLGEAVYDYILRLDDTAPGALQTGWQVVNVQPQKHIGYAVQWFVMALALLILTVFANSNLAQVWHQFRQKKSRSGRA